MPEYKLTDIRTSALACMMQQLLCMLTTTLGLQIIAAQAGLHSTLNKANCPVLSRDESTLSACCMQAPPQANGSIPFYTQLSLEQLSDKEDFVMQLLANGMQDNSCIVCSMVVAVQVPKTG